MILQVTLTVAEAKGIIAKAAAALPEVKNAFANGKIFLKGGTTVSAFAKELMGTELSVCGRISPRGTKCPREEKMDVPFHVLVEKGAARGVDGQERQAALSLQRDDVLVLGANAIDIYGNAAMMAGSPLGGRMGGIVTSLAGEGVNIFILAGLEKLIPINISEAAQACGRRKVDFSFGMAVGLIPLTGRIITEQTAVELLADVKCTVIGKGGVCGAEGSTTMVVEGIKSEIKKIYDYVRSVKGSTTQGYQPSLIDCVPGANCEEDLGCIYKSPIKKSFWD